MIGLPQRWGGPLVVIGDVVTDVVCRTVGPRRAGTDTDASITIRPGGSAANTAAWAAQAAGWAGSAGSIEGATTEDVVLIGRVGGDDAAWHRQSLIDVGVDPCLIVDHHSVTTRLVALIDEMTGERTMLTDRGAGLLLEPNEIDETQISSAGWVHLSGYLLFADAPRRTFVQIVQWCERHGVRWSVDPASSGFLADLGMPEARSLLAGASIGFPNADEALLLAGLRPSGDVEAAAVALCSLWGTVVVTRGSDGALVAQNGRIVGQLGPAVPGVAVIDAVGAGDAFAGAWLAAHLGGAPVEECLQNATTTARMALGLPGGRPPAGPSIS